MGAVGPHRGLMYTFPYSLSATALEVLVQGNIFLNGKACINILRYVMKILISLAITVLTNPLSTAKTY